MNETNELVHQPIGSVTQRAAARDIIPAADQVSAQLMESALLTGDLTRLQPAERMQYYRAVCDSLAINPLTRPFDYISLNGKLVLYAKKDCTDQLRKSHGISIKCDEPIIRDGVLFVRAYAATPTGRTDEAIGAVHIGDLKGEARANAFMKAETKAKRRVTLSICGLGFVDESEVESIAGASVVSAEMAHSMMEIPAGRPESEAPRRKSEQTEEPAPPADPPALIEAIGKFKLRDKQGKLDWFEELKQDLYELTGSHDKWASIREAHGGNTAQAAAACFREAWLAIANLKGAA